MKMLENRAVPYLAYYGVLFHTWPITAYSVRGLSVRRDLTLLGLFRPAHAAVDRRKVPR